LDARTLAAGLILFMFLMGLELDRSLLRKGLRQSVTMAATAIAVPFAVGCAVATWLSDVNEEGRPPGEGAKQPSSVAFLLFSGASAPRC
jgi:Kef-type K+ transport system membrane component KefB